MTITHVSLGTRPRANQINHPPIRTPPHPPLQHHISYCPSVNVQLRRRTPPPPSPHITAESSGRSGYVCRLDLPLS